MKKVMLVLLSLTIFVYGNTKTIEGFSSPESTIVNNQDVYVSNVGTELKPTTKDKDGFISKLNLAGDIQKLHFIDGLNAPKGMGIINNILYVSDVDTLRGFNLSTQKEVFNLVFKDVNFLNDITVKDSNTLFIGASDTSAIYEVNIKNTTYKKLLDFTVANGLFYEDGILYAAQLGSSTKSMFDGKGKLYRIDLKNNNKLTQLGNFEGVLDGVHKIGNKIYVSDWVAFKKAGIIRVYNLDTKQDSILKLEKFMAAADFWIDKKSNKLYLPEMIGGKITIIDLNNL
ncbi:ATP-binding protein [Arcobacteraceae bacterium]|nr:ATP-binding protein [Arcobacteraceae bacterium]